MVVSLSKGFWAGGLSLLQGAGKTWPQGWDKGLGDGANRESSSALGTSGALGGTVRVVEKVMAPEVQGLGLLRGGNACGVPGRCTCFSAQVPLHDTGIASLAPHQWGLTSTQSRQSVSPMSGLAYKRTCLL